MRKWLALVLVATSGAGVSVCRAEQDGKNNLFDVELRLPKGYRGLLLLAFDMPGGLTPREQRDIGKPDWKWPAKIVIDFDDQGVARYGYQNLPESIRKTVMVERETNQEIPLAFRERDLGNPLPARAALRDLKSGALRPNRRDFEVEVFLVGNPAGFPATLHDYPRAEIDKLLLQHFGLPLPEKPKAAETK